MSKTFNTRVLMKNDTATNWSKAVNFIPLKGEIIIYTDLNKIKIGNGTSKVNDLPFYDTFSGSYNDLSDKPSTIALSTSISAASTDNNAVSPKAVYDYVQMAITSLPTVYTGDTTPDSTFGNNGDIYLVVEE